MRDAGAGSFRPQAQGHSYTTTQKLPWLHHLLREPCGPHVGSTPQQPHTRFLAVKGSKEVAPGNQTPA